MSKKKIRKFTILNQNQIDKTWDSESIVLTIITLANSLTLFFTLFLSSYFTFNLLETISFRAQDGWCLAENTRFGSHCFGDFGFPITQLLSTNDVYNLTPPSNYTPWVTIIFGVFKVILLAFGWNVAIVLYSLLLVVPIWITIIDGLRNLQFIRRISLILSLCFFSPAIIMIFDRGNSVGLIVLPLYMFFKKLQNNSTWQYIFWGVIAIAIRPQSCIILIFLLIHRRFAEFFRIIIASSFIYVLGFYLMNPKNVMDNLIGFFNSLIKYGDLPLGGIWPYNYSVANAFAIVNKFASLGLSDSFVAIVGTSFALFFMFVVGFTSKYLKVNLLVKQSITFIWLLPFGYLLPSTSYGYYTCFGLLAMLVLLREKVTPVHLGFGNVKLGLLYLSTLSLTLTLAFIPASLLYTQTKANLLQIANPGLWTITYFCLMFRLIFLMRDQRIMRNLEFSRRNE